MNALIGKYVTFRSLSENWSTAFVVSSASAWQKSLCLRTLLSIAIKSKTKSSLQWPVRHCQVPLQRKRFNWSRLQMNQRTIQTRWRSVIPAIFRSTLSLVYTLPHCPLTDKLHNNIGCNHAYIFLPVDLFRSYLVGYCFPSIVARPAIDPLALCVAYIQINEKSQVTANIN